MELYLLHSVTQRKVNSVKYEYSSENCYLTLAINLNQLLRILNVSFNIWKIDQKFENTPWNMVS